MQELLRIAQGNWMLAEEEKKEKAKGWALGLLYLTLAHGGGLVEQGPIGQVT